MNRSWLFDIASGGTVYRWSLESVTYATNVYSPKIITGSFSGITLSRMGESGLCNLAELSFDILDPPAGIDFTGEAGTLRLLIGGVLVETWILAVRRYETVYGKAILTMTSLLEKYLDGYHPNTKQPQSIWPSEGEIVDDAYVVPQIFGAAMIPIRSVNTGTSRYYVLGKSGYTYTIVRVRTPKDWNGSRYTWLASAYTMTQSTDSGYALLAPIIDDSDGDGVADATGLWMSGEYFLDPAIKYTSTEISASDTVSPDVVIAQFFEDIGIPEGYIDTGVGSSFAAAATQYTSWDIKWVGGFYEQVTAEQRLENLLNQCNSYVEMTDKIKLYPRSTAKTTSVLTVDSTDVISGSFSYSPIWPSTSDGGHVEYIQGAGTPQTVTNKLVVPSDPSISDVADIDNPESTVLSCVYLRGDSTYDAIDIAQNLGILYFNRQLEQTNLISFGLKPTTAHLQLKPDQVITISDTLYGTARAVLISSVSIDEDIGIEIEAIEFSTGIVNWSDCTPIAYTIGDDTGVSIQSGVSSNAVSSISSVTEAGYAELSPKQEVNTLDLGGATGGTYLLGDGTTDTSAIAYDASTATIQAALETIYGSGDVTVIAGSDYVITFDLTIEDSDLEADFTNLTGATDPALTVDTAYDAGLLDDNTLYLITDA